MAVISRREFCQQAVVATGLATAIDLVANPLGLPIGSQTYPHRAMLKQDFPGLLKQFDYLSTVSGGGSSKL